MKLILASLITLIYSSVHSQNDSLRYYYQTGLESYEAKDFKNYLESFIRANKIRPNHPTITYNLASSYALNDKSNNCLRTLKILVAMNTSIITQVQKDEDFASIIETAEFDKIKKYALELSEVITTSIIKKRVDCDSIHMEGISYNGDRQEYYFGSVNTRSLFRLSNNELKQVIDSKVNSSIFSILGVAYDSVTNSVWFCTNALPQMKGFTDSLDGYSSIFQYDIKKDKVITEIVQKGNSAFGDLIVSSSSQVYISDGKSGKIYTIESGKSKLTEFLDLSKKVFNLQGITLSNDEKFLFVSDYITGIYKINVLDKSVYKIDFGSKLAEKGIDGLYYFNSSLIAIQNGTSPFRVIQLKLDSELTKVVSAKILDQARPEFNEPTQGVIIKGELIYISNSPWSNYTKENEFKNSEFKNLLLLSSQLQED